jgi:hypothetical protein
MHRDDFGVEAYPFAGEIPGISVPVHMFMAFQHAQADCHRVVMGSQDFKSQEGVAEMALRSCSVRIFSVM